VVTRQIRQRLLRLVECDRDDEPKQERNDCEKEGEVADERKTARDADAHEAVYSRSNGGSERVCEKEQKDDGLSFPQSEGPSDHGENDDSARKG
jgi:hypothetical protein